MGREAGPSIHLTDVTLRFGDVLALDDVRVTIDGGSFVALVGASGSGKSTLLRSINRLVQPDSGVVQLDGRSVLEGSAVELRRKIGYVFQNIGLFPHMTVAQNIGIGLRIAGESFFACRLIELLTLVDLPEDIGSRMPDQLSGGQRQRVGVARALATEPHVLLMDEPFGALDPVTRDALGKQVRALHDRLRLTTVMVTHDMAEALLLADRIMVMEAGRIVADGTPADLLAGRGGAAADALLAVPRDHARRLAALGA
ncbi:ATP-binding cassette domain-containing protein [Sphingobium sp. CECT 9361]|uniref:ATP-binding cassette domain-containing protein n=1 Tax=Sphingobium sp. CECT 9361 TaxID=2845384 RepID=UPI001E51B8CC|nr:ATP-binding cassette domain-containing protein [Sphingobium sp. CECT 9361]CAH0352093.1 Choline transport ATP-binding protein OpuBA [Sphingobium sp. CECT 9361]